MNRTRSSYVPGTSVVDITAPGGIAALLEFHRATFGDARMEATGGAGGDQGGTGAPEGGNGAEGSASGNGEGDPGFPANTPIREMTDAQQAAYWRHQARKHEDRVRGMADYDQLRSAAAELEQLRAASQTETERALEQARREAADAARAEARRETLPALVQAEFKAANAGRIPADKLAGILEPLDLTKFLSADGGEVDTDKVQQYVDGLAPAGGQQWPDMGQGRRGSTKPASGVSAGRSLYEDRHAKK